MYQEKAVAFYAGVFLLDVAEQQEIGDMTKPHSPATATLLGAARAAGFGDYDVSSGAAVTKKVARLRGPNGRPVVIQINNVTPRLWMLPEHEGGKLTCLGQHIRKAGDHRHSHLQQVREFAGHSLIKVIVEMEDMSMIRSALNAVGA